MNRSIFVFLLLLTSCKQPPSTTAASPSGAAAVKEENQEVTYPRLVQVNGQVKVDGVGTKVPRGVGKESVISTGADGHAVLEVMPASAIAVYPNSDLRLGSTPHARWSIRLVAGALLNFLPSGASYEVVTENAVAGVRGTRFFSKVQDANSTYVCACSGDVHLTAPGGGFDQVVRATAQAAHIGNTFTRKSTVGEVAVAPAAQHDHGPADEQALEPWLK